MKEKNVAKRGMSVVLAILMMASTIFGTLPNMNVQAAAKPTLNQTSVNLLVGNTTTLKLKKRVAGAKITWKSRNKKVVMVAKNGKIKGVKKGNARVTASVTVKKKKYNLNCAVKVIQKAKSLQITYNKGQKAENIQLKVGEKLTLNTAMSPKSSNDFVSSWRSASKKVATVNNKGIVTAVAPGSTTVTATAFGKAKKNVTVTVVGDVVTTKPLETVKPSANPSTNPTASPSASPTANPSASPSSTPVYYPVYENDFETEKSSFWDQFYGNPFSMDGSGPSVSRVNNMANGGNYSLRITGRKEGYHGAALFVNSIMAEGSQYYVRAFVRQDTGQSQTIKATLNYGSQTDYPTIAQVTCESGKWTKIEGYYDMNVSGQFVTLYFEMPNHATADFYLDDVSIEEKDVEFEPVTSSLKDAYKDLFSIGSAVTHAQLNNEAMLSNIKQHYNSITMENEMKPDAILGNSPNLATVGQAGSPEVPAGYTEATVPKLNFDRIDECLRIAKDNGLKMRGHTLIWHSQTPAWFFREGYATSGSNYVTPEKMNARMEYYIKQVLEHVQQSEFEGIIYAWDVCNEIFANSSGEMRVAGADVNNGESLWMQVYGNSDFAINAFRYARQYADPDVKLFYNDYNEYEDSKRDGIFSFLKTVYQQGNIDGMGMQSHLDVSFPTITSIGAAIDKFASIGPGFEIQLTELDVTINRLGQGKTLADQTKYYKDLMEMVVAKKKANVNITNVTLWGLYDQASWRSEGKPLLFTTSRFRPKDAYFSVWNAATYQP